MQDQHPNVLDPKLLSQWLLLYPILINIALILAFQQEPWFRQVHTPVWGSVMCLLIYVTKSKPTPPSLLPSFKQQKFKQIFSRFFTFFGFGPLFFALYAFLSTMPSSYQCGAYCFNSQTTFAIFTNFGIPLGIFLMASALLTDKFPSHPVQAV